MGAKRRFPHSSQHPNRIAKTKPNEIIRISIAGRSVMGRQANFKGRGGLKINAPVFILQHVPLMPSLIDPSGPACISAPKDGDSIFHSPHNGMSGMLLGTSFFSKPGVIRGNEKEIDSLANGFPDNFRENVLRGPIRLD
jgi:hypothetical protein